MYPESGACELTLYHGDRIVARRPVEGSFEIDFVMRKGYRKYHVRVGCDGVEGVYQVELHEVGSRREAFRGIDLGNIELQPEDEMRNE